MTNATLEVSEEQGSAGGLRLGSFQLGRRIAEGKLAHPSVVMMAAVGAAGTPFESRPAIAHCVPVNPEDAECVARAEDVVTRLRAVRHRSIIPVLEAGIAGGVAFAVEARLDGAYLADLLAEQGKLSPVQVRRLVDDAAAGLATAHAGGLRHGRLTPAAVWVSNDGGAAIGGFVAGATAPVDSAADVWRVPDGTRAEFGATSDQYQLALTAAAALTGEMPGAPGGVRDSLPGVPSVVVSVLSRATATKPDERYPDVNAFALAFGESIVRAGEDLIAGVWEASGRKDNGLAAIMLDMAQVYAPDHRDIPVLRVRMHGGSGNGIADLMTAGLGLYAPGRSAVREAPQSPFVISTPEEAAIAALLMPPQTSLPIKPKMSPWVAFAAGTFACLLLLVLAGALTLAYL